MYSPKSFKNLYQNLIKNAFKKFGFINSKLVCEWKNIVGPNLSQICLPDQIIFEPYKTNNGTLNIIVSNPAFCLEIQLLEGIIIERIATYFGYKAVGKIRTIIKVGAIAPAKKALSFKEDDAASKTIPQVAASVKDDEIKQLLSSIYHSLTK